MSLAKVTEYFKGLGMADRVLVFDSSSATVAQAAALLGCSEGEIAKTMSFKVGGKPVLVVTAGDARISNQKFKATFHTKASMLKGDEIEELTGHHAGGVCPFCTKPGVATWLDVSLKKYAIVYPAAGSDNSGVRLTPEELARTSDNFLGWVDVCKDPAPEA